MIQRLLNQMQDFFDISKKQAKGALTTIAICFFLILFPIVYKRFILPLFPLPAEVVDEKALDSLAAELNRQEPERETYSNQSKPEAFKTKVAINLRPFNPNTASVQDFETLGVPNFIAKRIDNYRNKGGKFKKKEDLLRIYDFPSDVYKQLEPFIILPENQANASGNSINPDKFTKYENKESAPTNPKTENKTYTKKTIAPFDINTTDTSQLIQLKGIGSKLSLRIIKFRDGIGGFHSTNQYSEVYGLDSLAVSELNKYAKIGSPVKKIKINDATLEELTQHTYLKNKKLASIIVNYRTQHGNFKSLEDLRKIRVMDDETIKKLEPYLEF